MCWGYGSCGGQCQKYTVRPTTLGWGQCAQEETLDTEVIRDFVTILEGLIRQRSKGGWEVTGRGSG